MAASAQEASGKDAPVAVITTFGCKYCMKVKSKLKQKGISFREVDLDKFPDALRAVKEATGQLTVPQVMARCMDCISVDLSQKYGFGPISAI